MTVMTREFVKRRGFSLSPEARQRAHDHLLSVGYTEDQLKPIKWPEDALSAYKDCCNDEWKFFTIGDRRRRRQKHAKEVLYMKREHGVTKIQPLYVWVFFCFGIGNTIDPDDGYCGIRGLRSTGLMSGWFAYLIGQDVSVALNFRGGGDRFQERVMELFPLVKATTLFDGPDFDEWMLSFVERYPKGLRCEVPQGKAVVHAEVCGGRVVEILEVGQWPKKSKQSVKAAG